MFVCEYYWKTHNVVNLHQRKAAVDMKLHSWADLAKEQKHSEIWKLTVFLLLLWHPAIP